MTSHLRIRLAIGLARGRKSVKINGYMEDARTQRKILPLPAVRGYTAAVEAPPETKP